MHPIRRALLRLRAIVGRRGLENDMQTEMREHLERTTERLVARGMSIEDARIEARREFGNLTALQEESRDAWGARWMDALAGDLHFAFRYFARHKATVTMIIAVLALGTGANAVIFSTFQSMFLRPAPAVPNDAAHARIWALQRATRTARWEPRGFSRSELEALAQHREAFSRVAAWTSDDVVLDGGDSTGARGVGAQFVTPNYFATLGVQFVAGQGFAQDLGRAADMTAVMSHQIAELLYGNAANAVGRQIVVNERPVHIVGVAPSRFQGALHNMNEPALWIPLSARADIARVSPNWLDEGTLSVFARLTPGASRGHAAAVARQIVANALPDSASRVGMARTAHVLGMREPPPGEDTAEMIMAFAAVATIGVVILLVAWMNVSSLMVAAAVGRRHEIAVRTSLGASRTRLLRQLVTESTLLALAGGALGLFLAWGVLTFQAKTEIDGYDVAPDAGTFAFVLAIALGTGILFGLSPALHATRGVAGALRDSGAGSTARSRLQRVFVVAQIALSQPLLVMLGTAMSVVITQYRPVSPEMSRHVIAIGFRPLERTGAPAQRAEAVDSLVPRIAGRPGVMGAVPDASGFDVRGVFARDRRVTSAQADTVPTIVHVEGAAPGWFTTVDVPIVLGRDVSLGDTTATDRPIVIGSDLARSLWGDATPLGRTLASPGLPGLGQDSISMTVVGVYDATRRLPGMTWGGATATGSTPVRVYTAHGKQWRHDRLLVRTRGPAETFLMDLQRFLRAEAPSLPVASMMTLAQADSKDYQDRLRFSMLLGAGGALALLLASLGLYGVVSLAVQQRKREIGVRIAVGAHPMQVARMFLRSGVRVSVIALLLGLPLSMVGLRVAISQGVLIAQQINVFVIGVVIAAVLLAVASAATWVPARRAALVDPARTLRVE